MVVDITICFKKFKSVVLFKIHKYVLTRKCMALTIHAIITTLGNNMVFTIHGNYLHSKTAASIVNWYNFTVIITSKKSIGLF